MVAESIKGSVLIYSTIACPLCMKAKNKLAELGIPFSEVSLDSFPQCRTDMELRTNGKTSTPQIFFNEIHIGGYDELQALVNDKDRFEMMMNMLRSTEATANAPVAPKPETAVNHSNDDTDDGDLTGELDEYAKLVSEMKKANLIKDHREGLFKVHKSSFKGQELIDWLTKIKHLDRKRALEMGQELIDRNFGQQTSNQEGDTFSPDRYYQLLEDDESLALNAGSTAETTPLKASELNDIMRRLIQCIHTNALSKDGKTVDYAAIAEDEDFEKYITLSKELQRVDLLNISRDEKLALFINVYNMLVIHATVKMGPPSNMWQRYKFFNSVHYLIGGHSFSLNNIENGVLRANRKGFGTLWRPFGKNDERLKIILQEPEPLVHFVLNSGARSCPPINTFSAKNVKEELKTASEQFLDSDDGVKLDSTKRAMHISKLFKYFQEDFGSSDIKNLEWILERMADGEKKTELKKLYVGGSYSIDYLPFDWTHNGKESAEKTGDKK